MSIALHPVETSALIIQPQIPGLGTEFRGGGEAEDVGAIVRAHDHHVLVGREAGAVVGWLAGVSELEAPAVDPE